MKWLNQVLKRCMDIAVSMVLLLAAAPLLVLTFIVIRRTSEGPALFRQKRVEKDGRVFTILKFRTMMQNAPDLRNADNRTFNVEDDPRVTKIGRLLRKSRCDELPQLVDAQCEEMNLVRPWLERPEWFANYKASQVARLRVRLGTMRWLIFDGGLLGVVAAAR